MSWEPGLLAPLAEGVFDELKHPRGRGGQWVPKVGSRVRIVDPAQGKMGVLTHTVTKIKGKQVTVKTPIAPSLGGGQEKTVHVDRLRPASGGGAPSDAKINTELANAVESGGPKAIPAAARRLSGGDKQLEAKILRMAADAVKRSRPGRPRRRIT